MAVASLEVYFWMLDRLQIEDDTRNKVNKTNNNVILGKPFTKRVENGHYIGRLLTLMYPTFAQRSGKTFSIPAQLTEIEPEAGTYSRAIWTPIFQTLDKYGCQLGEKRQNILIQTAESQNVIDIFECLYEIDNNHKGQISAQTKRKLDIKTTFGTRKYSVANPVIQNDEFDRQSEEQSELISTAQKPPRSQFNSERKASVQPNSVGANRASAKLSPLDQRNSIVTPTYALHKRQFSTVDGDNSSLPGRLLGKESSLIANPDQLDEAMPTSLLQCRTSVQFILTSISTAFNLKPKQAATLLANNHKVIQHLCIKGGKGSDFTQVLEWYKLVTPKAGDLISLIGTEKQDIMSYAAQQPTYIRGDNAKENRGKILQKTFNILKNGFYSRSDKVQIACGELFLELIKAINESQSEIANDAYEWLTKPTQFTTDARSKKGVNFDLNKDGGFLASDTELGRDLEANSQQTGLHAIIYTYVRNQNFTKLSGDILLHFGLHDANDLFLHQIQQQTVSWTVFNNVCFDLYTNTLEQPFANKVLESSGVIRSWFLSSVQVVESTGNLPLDDRIVSLVFMVEIWRTKTKLVERALVNAAEKITRALKRAARDMKRTLVVISIELLFRVLDTFAAEKHAFAPNIYKTLTFLLVEFYWEVDVREMMLRSFIELFHKHVNIPINILCEPLLAQIEVSQYHEAAFNVFDFQFFRFIAQHQRLPVQVAVLLQETLVKISLSSSFYQSSAIELSHALMTRFRGIREMRESLHTTFRGIMQSLANMEARIVLQRYHLKYEENAFYNNLSLQQQFKTSGGGKKGADQNTRLSDHEFLGLQFNRKLLVNLLEKVIQFGDASTNADLRLLLIDTYIALQTALKQESRAIRYLLAYFTNQIDSMIVDRMTLNPQAVNSIAVPFLDDIKHMTEGMRPVQHSKQAIKPALDDRQHPRQQLQQRVDLVNMLAEEVTQILPLGQILHQAQTRQKSILYDYLSWEEPWAIKQYQQFLNKHKRVYKELHNSYHYQGAVKKPKAIDHSTFEDNAKLNDTISAQSLLKLIKDFKLDMGLPAAQIKDEVYKIVKAIAVEVMHEKANVLDLKSASGTVQDLNFDGFRHFLLQFAYRHWGSQGDGKAVFMVERLFEYMSQQPKFKELGLVYSKVETTNRKEIELLHVMEEKIIKKGAQVPLNHKRIEEKREFVEYAVPDVIPIPKHKKVCIELMDEILFLAIGVHFLEPIPKERTVIKVVPKYQSVRAASKLHTQISNNAALHGLRANQPLHRPIFLSLAQEEAKKVYEEATAKKVVPSPLQTGQLSLHNRETYRDSNLNSYHNSTVPAPAPKPSVAEIQKTEFKAQAINRRAAAFGEAMQLTIIDEPMPDKKIMFEAAEVLNEVLNAVEQGKKALRLDFTPYRLYEMYKKKVQLREDPLGLGEIVSEPDTPQTKQKKKQKVDSFMNKASAYLSAQKAKLIQDAESFQKQVSKGQRAQSRRMDVYRQSANKLLEEKELEKQKLFKLQQLEDNKLQREIQSAREQAKNRIKESVRKYKHDLREQEAHMRQRQYESLTKEDLDLQHQKQFRERQAKIHQLKRAKINDKKTSKRDQFYQWIASAEVQDLLNRRYRKGLFLKYVQVQKMSKSVSGVSVSAWLEWYKQLGVVKTQISAQELIRLHSHQVKEIGDIPDYSQWFNAETKDTLQSPGPQEINYGGFVAAIVKLSNLEALLEQQKNKPASKVKISDYEEYELPTDATKHLQKTLEQLNIKETTTARK